MSAAAGFCTGCAWLLFALCGALSLVGLVGTWGEAKTEMSINDWVGAGVTVKFTLWHFEYSGQLLGYGGEASASIDDWLHCGREGNAESVAEQCDAFRTMRFFTFVAFGASLVAVLLVSCLCGMVFCGRPVRCMSGGVLTAVIGSVAAVAAGIAFVTFCRFHESGVITEKTELGNGSRSMGAVTVAAAAASAMQAFGWCRSPARNKRGTDLTGSSSESETLSESD
uniref:Claudin n=1 Tax=Zooxanthella nutricula TaxID=1333877 RepID=A0A7S2PVY2_9DINO